jgi:WD40 repeat protein
VISTPPTPPEGLNESTAAEDRDREGIPASAPGFGPGARPEVVQLLEEYLEQLEEGTALRPEEWLARHPELDGPPEEYLATLALLHQTALGLGRAAPPEAGQAPEEPAPGQLGDYRLVREVGRGGMGIVFEAEQLSLGRPVALKVLPLAGALDARQLQRFHNEALTASQLRHPHIVDVFGAGCERGVHYYAMRYIAGQTLAQLIDRMRKLSGLEAADAPGGEAGRLPAAPPETGPLGQLPTRDSAQSPGYCRAAAAIAAQVAEALDYAHEHDVVHRDVKPSNVMLDAEGQAWVTDFGLAHLQRQAHLTHSGDLLGTLRYMSPEQARARREVLDHRTDIYALGATLYELLTLQPAVRGTEREEILHWLTCEEPVWPSRLNPAIPPDLEAIVLKAMAKAPAERYGTAQELAEDLRRFVNAQPVLARRPTRLQQAGKWARRHHGPLLAAAATTVLLLALAVVLLALGNVRIRHALVLSDLQAQQQRARAAEREQTLQLALTRWNESRLARQARQPGQRYRSLEALAEAVRHLRSLGQLETHRPELRDDALASLTLWDVRAVQHQPRVPGLPWPVVDPLGRHYASVDAPNRISWRRRADDQVVRRWQLAEGIFVGHAVSPNGRYVFAGCHDGPRGQKPVGRVWDSGTGQVVLERPIFSFAHSFRPDGQVLALVQADGSIALCDLGTGRDLPPVPAAPWPDHVRFHPSGQYLAVSSRADQDIAVWDLAAGKVVLRLVGEEYGGASLAWSPDGSLLAAGSPDTNIYICTFPGGDVQAVLRGHEHIVTGVEYHPSGRLLASASHDDTTRLWCVFPGSELVLPGETLLGFSRDGRRLTTGSGRRVTEWELAGLENCLHYLPHGPGPSRGPWGIAFSPSGRLLASASPVGVLLWDAAAAHRVGRVPSGDGYALAFHPDGRRLFTTGSGGLMQWPIAAYTRDPQTGGLMQWPISDAPGLTIGPGTLLRATNADSRSLRIDTAGRGKWLLLGAEDGGMDLVPLAEAGGARRLGTHECLFGVALSPDGRWAVSAGDSGGDAFCIWDVAQGTFVRRLPHQGAYPGAAFSPEGRWLVTGVRSDFCFWEVGSWERKAGLSRDPRSLFSSVAFARDGGLLALVDGRNRIGLHDAVTLRHLATLETPAGPASLTGLSLSPDGTRLAAATDYGVIALWDLHRLRHELAALDLDWEMPPYPPAGPPAELVPGLTVEILAAPAGPR